MKLMFLSWWRWYSLHGCIVSRRLCTYSRWNKMGGCRSPECGVREELCSHLFANLSGLAGLGSGGRQGHKLFDYLHVPQSIFFLKSLCTDELVKLKKKKRKHKSQKFQSIRISGCRPFAWNYFWTSSNVTLELFLYATHADEGTRV